MASTIQDIYVTGLRNAHALEAQADQLLSRQVERIENYPAMSSACSSISRKPAASRSGWSRSCRRMAPARAR